MARISRLKGAVLAESEGRFFLIGAPKEPLDFEAHGFKNPGEIEAPRIPYIELVQEGQIPANDSEILTTNLEGEALAEKLAQSFMILRNGSISERLWGLVTETTETKKDDALDVDWLAQTPEDVWDIVRDAVLRC